MYIVSFTTGSIGRKISLEKTHIQIRVNVQYYVSTPFLHTQLNLYHGDNVKMHQKYI